MTKTEIKYGLILGLGICVYTLVAHVLGFYKTNIQTGKYGDMVIALLPVIVLFMAIREKRILQNHLKIWQGVRTGLLVALISYLISMPFLWIYHHFINPNWLEYILAYEREQMMGAGISASDTVVRLDAIRSGNSDFAQIVGGLIGTIILGLVLSFTFSLIYRKK